MEIYCVGGAVRDRLLDELRAAEAPPPHRPEAASPGAGTPPTPTDRDWVVVGTTPAELLARGFKPVGRDFPVFLHPQTHEEYALARTERKSAPGYHGFVFQADPSVTLEADLARRDLTVNAMAETADGRVVDPYGGRRDLALRVLRHVSPAFAEDPVRILRLARFAARWPDFSVADETTALAREMVAAGEVEALVPERVWQELSRGLLERRPSRLFDVLHACGALARLMPEVDRAWMARTPGAGRPPLAEVIDRAARCGLPLAARFACLCLRLGDGVDAAKAAGAAAQAPPTTAGPCPSDLRHAAAARRLAERLRAPTDCRALAEMAARERWWLLRTDGWDAAAVLALFERCDALRRPERFAQALQVCDVAEGGTPSAPAAPAASEATAVAQRPGSVTDADGTSDAPATDPPGETAAEPPNDAAASTKDTASPSAPPHEPAGHRTRRLLELLHGAVSVDAAGTAAEAASRGLHGPAVGQAVREARLARLQAWLSRSARASG